MGYKMKGFKNFGEGTPLFQKKGKNYESSKGDQQGPIPEQNIAETPGEKGRGTWIYGRGFEGDDPKDGIKEMESDRKMMNKHNRPPKKRAGAGDKFVEDERINDYEERSWTIKDNDLQDDDEYLGGGDKKKGAKKRKALVKSTKTLDREAEIMRDRSKNKQGKKSYYKN